MPIKVEVYTDGVDFNVLVGEVNLTKNILRHPKLVDANWCIEVDRLVIGQYPGWTVQCDFSNGQVRIRAPQVCIREVRQRIAAYIGGQVSKAMEAERAKYENGYSSDD